MRQRPSSNPLWLVCAALLVVAACGDDGAEAPTPDARLQAFCGVDYADVEAGIDATIAALSLEEKVSLMHGFSVIPDRGAWRTTALPDQDIAGFAMLDGPRGLSRFSGRPGTAFPVAMARGATWDIEMEREVGRWIGDELRFVGADVLLAPTVNILRHPRWGRAQETYGEDTMHMGAFGTAFVQGAQEHVLTVIKHFAANSIEDTRLEVDVELSERTLREIYLPHFRRMVQEGGAGGVMTSYNKINGVWGSEHTHLIRDILRGEWGFVGITVSDFTWGTHDTVRAIEGGLDIEMQYPQVYGEPLVDAVNAGDVDVALVDEAVRRILRAERCFASRTRDTTIERTESEAALDFAQQVARQSMVLLKNSGGVLPIERREDVRIAVVGELAGAENTGDRGSSAVNSRDVVTFVEGLEAAAGDATLAYIDDSVWDDDAVEAVGVADVVIAVVGYDEGQEGEGQIAAGDRDSMMLPERDLDLLADVMALNEQVVVVYVGGSSVLMDGWQDDADAIVVAWYAGVRGGDALAELLFGDANFSGRLPISFAARESDLPEFDNESLTVQYGYYHGYRHLQNEGHQALYPFGYGLSYTSFSYDGMRVAAGAEAVTVEVDVTNTGDVPGAEVVQVYVGAPGVVAERAPRDLRGFTRLELEPGESATATIELTIDELRYFDEAASDWALEVGDYHIDAGPNVRDIMLTEVISL